jgi:internalin A
MILTQALLTEALAASSTTSNAEQKQQTVSFTNRDITEIEDLSFLTEVRKLNLSNNQLVSATGLSHLTDLTWLNLSNNQLTSLDFTGKLKQLSVLNMSHNQVRKMNVHIQNCTRLKALILNGNALTSIQNLSGLSELNTLVVSHNEIKKVELSETLPALTKLSLTHNKLTEFPSLGAKPLLKEIKLNNNAIKMVPGDLVKDLKALEILDLGNNQISALVDLEALGCCSRLHQLNLKGNPIVANVKNLKEEILKLMPRLRVFNGERFDEKFLSKKKAETKVKKVERTSEPRKFKTKGQRSAVAPRKFNTKPSHQKKSRYEQEKVNTKS